MRKMRTILIANWFIIIGFLLWSSIVFAEISLPKTNDAESTGWDGVACGGVADVVGDWCYESATACVDGGEYLDTTYNHTSGGSKSFETRILAIDAGGDVHLGGSDVQDYMNAQDLYVRWWFRTTIPYTNLTPQGPKMWWINGDVFTWGEPFGTGNQARWQFYGGGWRCLTVFNGDEGDCPTCMCSTKVVKTNDNEDEIWDDIDDGNWHKFEMWFEGESVYTANDGVFKLWIDDVLLTHYTGCDFWRSSESAYWADFAWGGNWSGGDPDNSYYHDDIYVDDELPSGDGERRVMVVTEQ